MLVILIINIYSIVTSLEELVVLTKSASEYCFCRNEPFGTFVKSAELQSNHFVPLLSTIQKRKESNPSHNSSPSKKICLKLPKMESLVSRFNKGKQSKLEFKPCSKPLFVSSMVSQSTSLAVFLNSDCVKLSTSILPTFSSSTVTSASLSSFNCSSGNTASNVDCTIQDDADSFSGKGKYKNEVLFSLCVLQMTFQVNEKCICT